MHRNFETKFGSEAFAFKAERPKNTKELQKKLILDISAQVNEEVERDHGISNLLDSECQVKTEAFKDIYSEDFIAQSAQAVHEREIEFSGATRPNMQAFYKDQHGIEGEEAIIAKWKSEKKKNKNTQMELAVTALLYKVLHKNNFIFRTNPYDDYINGGDTIIIDKETGSVVCAFDEVHEGGSGDRTLEKQNKISKIAHKGGARLRFGLVMENGKLKPSKLENLPIFYLGLNTEELNSLMENMEYDLNKEPSPQEIAIYKKLIDSVQEQFGLLEKEDLPEPVTKRLTKFKETLVNLGQY